MAVNWSRRASLECLRTKAVLKANAISRIKVTAARPWLETGCRSPEAVVCLGRCRQAWRNPCLKAQCFVRSIATVVFILPSAVPQLADDPSGKGLLGQSGDPEPFVVGGMRSQFSFAVTI